MRVPRNRTKPLGSSSGALRSSLSITAACALVVIGGVRSASAAAAPSVMPAGAHAIAKQLASAAKVEPIGSCTSDDTAGSPISMFGASAIGSGVGGPGDPPVGAVCALPYRNGQPGSDCTGNHTIQVGAVGTGPNAKITAELMGLDVAGNLIQSFLVQNGDVAHLASRLSPADWKFAKGPHDFSVFAPVPLLHVTVEDQGQKAEAFCSNIPYAHVYQPNGGVVTESSGNQTHVLAGVPLTNPSSLKLYVDGVDLLAQVPNFIGCTALSPCSGMATINGNTIGYEDLVVDIAASIGALSSNTVRVTIDDLACGGHIFKVSTVKLPGSLKTPTSSACNVDDLTDIATSSVFAISISDPTPGEVTAIIPTPVAGEVCAGTRITDVSINGKILPVSGETFQAGNGITSGDVYTVIIDTTLDKSDLVRDVLGAHDLPLGSFDAGTNRLEASAREIKGNRTFKNFIFATGDVAAVGVDPNATIFQAATIQTAVNTQIKQLVKTKLGPVLDPPTSTDLQNAFIVGLSAGGTQTLFNQLCTTPVVSDDPTINGKTPGQIFQSKVTEAILSINTSNNGGPPTTTPSVPCASDPTVTLTITEVDVADTVSCNVDFHDHFFHVKLGLPDIHVKVHAFGTAGDWGATVCGEGVKVEGDATADVTGINLGFDVTEDNLLLNTFSNANFDAGATVTSNGTVGVDFCGFSVFCNVLVTIFTFGAIDINPHIDFHLVENFSTQIGASQPDPVKLKEIKVDEQVVANFDQKLSGAVTEVHITPDGISAGLKGTFATLAVDPSVETTPGITLTPAPVPNFGALRSQGVEDAFIGLSDDSINMMFASLTAAGKLKTGDDQGCSDTGLTVGSLLPANCDSLTINLDPMTINDVGTVLARGYCHAIKGDSCNSIVYNNPALSATDNANLTATEQGECHGAEGHVCTDAAVNMGNGVIWGACALTPNFNLHANQPLMFCAKGDVPPRMLFPNSTPDSGGVPTALRLNDLSVALVIDRTGNHAVDTPLPTTPGCFATGASTAVDCNVFSACLDLNLNFSMQFLNSCPSGKPGFKSTFDSVQLLNRQLGVVCSGATSPTTDANVIASASDQNTITIPISTNAGQLSPDICGAGLDLGGFVTCTTPEILAVEADGMPDLRDYLGITCKIQ